MSPPPEHPETTPDCPRPNPPRPNPPRPNPSRPASPAATGVADARALVVMPGTGSDADYVRRAFASTAEQLGIELVTPEPQADLVESHRKAIDRCADEYGAILVGGVSIGGAIAVQWALAEQARSCGGTATRCRGVLAALPPWNGAPTEAPAAAIARVTAESILEQGLETTIATMSATSPPWLAAELSRSWRSIGSQDLPAQLHAATAHHCPEPHELTGLDVPLAIVVAVDDPVHPAAIGRSWHAAAVHSALREVTLQQWGSDPACLGIRLFSALREIVGH